MIYLLIASAILITVIWYLGLRASAIYGAYLAGSLAHQFGLHWIMIVLCGFSGAVLVYILFHVLAAMSEKRPALALLLILLVSGPPFLVGFSFIFHFMRSPDQGAGVVESVIASAVVGVLMAGASFGAYRRDVENSL